MTKRTVVFMAVNEKYRDRSWITYPLVDASTNKLLTGQEHLSEQELKKEPFIVKEDTQVIVSNRMALTICGSPEDKRTKDDVIYGILMTQDIFVAPSFATASPEHLFYVLDQDKVADEELKKTDKIYIALHKVKEELPENRFIDVAMFLDLAVTNKSMSTIRADIYRTCSQTPEKVLAYFNPENKWRIFIKKCLYYNVLERRAGKNIYAKGTDLFLGASIDEAVNFIQQQRNLDYLDGWASQLDRKENPQKETSDISTQANDLVKDNVTKEKKPRGFKAEK